MDPTLLKHLIILVRFSVIAVGLFAGYLALFFVIPFIVGFLVQLPIYFLPFILAVVVAILIEPFIRYIQKKTRFARGTSVLCSLILVWGSLGLAVALLIRRLTQELVEIYHMLTISSSVLSQDLAQAIERIQELYLRLPIPDAVADTLLQNTDSFMESIRSTVQISMNILFNFLGALPGVLTILVISIISTYYLCRDRTRILNGFYGLFRFEWMEKSRAVIRQLGQALIGFVRAQSILISLTALTCMLGLTLLGSEYALTLGIIIGFLDILPIIGPGVLFIPWGLWMLATGNQFFGCGLLVLYGIIVVARQVLEPKVVAANIGLHPLATLMGLFVGLKFGGFIGMILGPVILVVLQALFRSGLIRLWPLNQSRI